MDLGRSFENSGYPEVSQPFFKRQAGEISCPACGLQGVIEGIPTPGCAEKLGVRAFNGNISFRVFPGDGR